MLEREISTPETAPYQLSNHCRLVTGVQRAAIYNLEKGNVYSLNEVAREIISGSLDKFDFWKKLTEMGLAESSSGVFFPDVKLEIPQIGLEFMWLELTERCNQKCLHCYASAGELVQTKEMSVVKWEKVIEEGSKLGCRKLQFIGGEPLLFRGIFDLVRAARELNYEFIEIFTNGTLLNEDKIRQTKDLGIHVQ